MTVISNAIELNEPLSRSRTKDDKEKSPYRVLNKYLTFSTRDQEQWWQRTGPLLANVLASAGYGPELQYQYLTFYYKQLVPRLGPYPQRYLSAITRSGLPLEFSVNYQQHGGDPVARIGFEPVDFCSGTERDLYNQLPVSELVSGLSRMRLRGFDTQLFSFFEAKHTVNQADKLRLQGALVEGSELKSQMAFGFDLKAGDIVVKGYSFPALKTKASGKGFGRLLGDSIVELKEEMDCVEAFQTVDDFMGEVDGYNQFAFFSWDCVVPSKSRLKFYGVANDVTWTKIETLWTLNKRANSPTHVQGLESLRKLWDLMALREGVKEFHGGFDDGTQRDEHKEAPMVWNYEMKPGVALPLTKFYFPVHGVNDLKCVTALARFFHLMGWKELAATYPATVQAFFPDRDLAKTERLVSWVSFAYTEKTGVYLSVYYHSSLDFPWAKE